MNQNRLDCSALGVDALSHNEMDETNGGLFWVVLGAALGLAAAVCALIDVLQKD